MTKPKPRVTVLTGAGASKPLGLPTMEALLPNGFEPQLQGEERDVYDMAANWAALQNPRVLDFEFLFTIVDAVANLRDSDPVAMAFAAPRGGAGGFLFRQADGRQVLSNLSSYRRAAASLVEHLKRVVHDQLARPDRAGAVKLYHDFFRVVASVISPPVIDLFTTNYDRAVEVSHEAAGDGLADLDFDLVKGFAQVGRERVPRWDPKLYDRPPRKRLTVKLYKLHGSLDWRREGGVVQEVGADEYVPGRNAVIYPIRKPRVEEPFKTLFELFKRRLRKSKVCVVIGSSLRDEHLRKVLVDQINAGTLRVVLADPHASEIADLLRADLPLERSAHLLMTSNIHFGGTSEEKRELEEQIRRAAIDALLLPSSA